MQSALSVYMGSEAAKTIGEQGWQSALFSTLIGASGGPKWLILSELDKVLGPTLLLGRGEPMTLLGSSIGTWRHACLSLNDPGAAISRLQQAYLYQEYSCARPSPTEVSEVAEQMLREALGPEGARQITNHPTLRNAIVTARAKGVARGENGWRLGMGMATASLGNAVSHHHHGRPKGACNRPSDNAFIVDHENHARFAKVRRLRYWRLGRHGGHDFRFADHLGVGNEQPESRSLLGRIYELQLAPVRHGGALADAESQASSNPGTSGGELQGAPRHDPGHLCPPSVVGALIEQYALGFGLSELKAGKVPGQHVNRE